MNSADFPLRDWSNEDDRIDWIFTGRWSLLDNFAPTPVDIWDRTYMTSEHAYAAAKAARREDHLRVARQPSADHAKMVGRSIRMRDDWDEVKFDIMWRVLQAKFSQHPECVEDLLATGNRVIVEGNVWDDRIWGATAGSDGLVGQNALGCMLMLLRDEKRS